MFFSVQHHPSDSPQKNTYLDCIKLTAPWHKNWFTEDKISQLSPPQNIPTLKESALRRQTRLCCSKIGFLIFYIYKGVCILKHTHTQLLPRILTHCVHDQVASGVRKWEELSVKQRNDAVSVKPVYTQKLIAKTFTGKNYSKPLQSISS